MSDYSDYIVIQRSAGERTEKACREIVELESAGREVFTVREEPFKKALEECFRIGISNRSKWLVTIDADMLLIPGALEVLHNQAETMPDHYVQLQGRIFDKITGSIRKAGPRIYRAKYLPKALEISKTSEDHIRPEAHVVTTLAEMGYPSRYISAVTCFHDFEQYYSDLYRKTLVHATKHTEFVTRIIQRSAENLDSDLDFKVILKAIWDGLTDPGDISINTRIYKDRAERALKELDLAEKAELHSTISLSESIDRWIELLPDDNLTDLSYLDVPKPEYSFFMRFKNITEKKGLINGIRFGMGSILADMGDRMKKNSDNLE